jgi:hypothetical protein
MGTRLLSLGVKWPGLEVDHLPPSSAEVKNEWSYASTPAICLHGRYRDNFTLVPTYVCTYKTPMMNV